jgi:hypothetical protein
MPSAGAESEPLVPGGEIEEPTTARGSEDGTASATAEPEVVAPELTCSTRARDESVEAWSSAASADVPDGPSEAEDTDAVAEPLPTPIAESPPPRPAPTAAQVPVAVVHAPVGFSATNLRAAPRQNAASLRLLPNGMRVVLLGPYAYADGFRWIRVRTLDGLVGWAVAVAL